MTQHTDTEYHSFGDIDVEKTTYRIEDGDSE